MLIFCCPIFALRINRHLFLKKEFQIPEVMSHLRASQVVLVVKNPPVNAVNAGDEGLIPGSGRSPGKRKWQPTPVFLPVESHGQRSLAGYGP